VAVDPYHPTGWVSVRLDARGVPDYMIHRAVAWDHVRWSERLEQLAGRADAVCFGTLAQREAETRESIRRFVQRTREDCLRVCDVNLRQAYYDRDVLEWSVRHCSVLKLNDQELPVVSDLLGIGGDGVPAARAIVKRFGVSVVAVTRGERGSWLVTEDGLSEENVEAGVEVVDTVGAGDAFTAALVVGMLKERPPADVHRAAGRVASYVCSKRGAMVEGADRIFTAG
jgi:fructokinase